MGKNAFVTLATSYEQIISATVLSKSIRNVGAQEDIVIVVGNEIYSSTMTWRYLNHSQFTKILSVNGLVEDAEIIHDRCNNPNLSAIISKIVLWKLTDYQKCVFLDSNCFMIKPVEELFQKDELSAVCDLRRPENFNSGVFVFKPSQHTFDRLWNLAKTKRSFDGGDQGFLNQYFTDWLGDNITKRLSLIYNMHSAAILSNLPEFKKSKKKTKIVHFLGEIKPWHYQGKSREKSKSSDHDIAHVSLWWEIMEDLEAKLKEEDEKCAKKPKVASCNCLIDQLRKDPSSIQELNSENDKLGQFGHFLV